MLSEQYSSEEDVIQDLKTKYCKKIEEQSKDLIDIIRLISKAMVVVETPSGGSAQCKLTNNELQVCAMKIPAICGYLQSELSSLTMLSVLNESLIDIKIAQRLRVMPKEKNASTLSERTKIAESEMFEDISENIAQKQYIKSIQDLIVRADKLYEGVKKTLDYRGRELWFDNKPIK